LEQHFCQIWEFLPHMLCEDRREKLFAEALIRCNPRWT